jgi:probable rRNA maturation factor
LESSWPKTPTLYRIDLANASAGWVVPPSSGGYPDAVVNKARKPAVAIVSCQRRIRLPRKKLRELIEFVARQEGAGLAEVDLAVVDSRRMAELNRRYLGQAGVTDVLSFDLSEAAKPGLCAQLVVCGDVAARQGRLRGQSPLRELMLYVVHGLLHLMGYEDQSIRGAARMHAREEEFLDAFAKGRGKGNRS